MLKQITTAAFAIAAMSAFAGEDFNFDSSSVSERKAYVIKHAYKTLNAPDAYVIESFIKGLPGNKASAIVNGLARNAWQAKMIKDENQTSANMMAPMGDNMAMANDWSKKDWSSLPQDESRPMRMLAMASSKDVSYPEAIKILNSGNDLFDQGLIWDTFGMRSFTESYIPTVMNERALDAIVKQIEANAKWTEPVRLKYTSLAPRQAYMGWNNSGR